MMEPAALIYQPEYRCARDLPFPILRLALTLLLELK